MTVAAVGIFDMFGTMVDELVDISDIMSRLLTCKDVRDEPSEAAEALLIFWGARAGVGPPPPAPA